MNFEEGKFVEYKGFVGEISFVDSNYLSIARPSVIGNPWPITVVVHRSEFYLINEVSSDL
jgi:hypothetical protein